MFDSLVIIITTSFTHTFLIGSHKITLAVTTLSQACELAKLHMSVLYLITVIVNHMINTLLQKKSTIQDSA